MEMTVFEVHDDEDSIGVDGCASTETLALKRDNDNKFNDLLNTSELIHPIYNNNELMHESPSPYPEVKLKSLASR